jgi:hypothetical protein
MKPLLLNKNTLKRSTYVAGSGFSQSFFRHSSWGRSMYELPEETAAFDWLSHFRLRVDDDG